MKFVGLSPFALIFFYSCSTPPGQEWHPTLGYQPSMGTATITATGGVLSGSGDVDFVIPLEVQLGATRSTPRKGGRALKHEFAFVSFGGGEAEDDLGGTFDISTISGGGRIYYDKGEKIIPFFSFSSHILEIEDYYNPQLGIKVGGGLEFPMDNMTAMVGADYLIPIREGDLDPFGLVQWEASGLSLQAGIVFGFGNSNSKSSSVYASKGRASFTPKSPLPNQKPIVRSDSSQERGALAPKPLLPEPTVQAIEPPASPEKFTPAAQCQGTAVQGHRCLRMTTHKSGYCWEHLP